VDSSLHWPQSRRLDAVAVAVKVAEAGAVDVVED